MTKKLLKIFSPKFISRGETFRAEGAMISLSSSAPASKISLGKMEEISAFSSFLPKILSKNAMLFGFDRLFCFSRVERFVEKFDHCLCSKPRYADAGAHEPLLDHRETLFKLAPRFFKASTSTRFLTSPTSLSSHNT